MTIEVTTSELNVQQDAIDQQAIVIGAGPAGLAVGACLKQAGIQALILEQTEKVGATWHQHYERLHLHTAKAYSALPFVPFPKETPRYPSRLQVISYLEAYARQFKLEVSFGQRVSAVHRVDGYWKVKTQDNQYKTKNLVIATGYNREPYRPYWPGQTAYRGKILHSSEYNNGEPFRNQNVLVVGFGNSGGEIAIDLCEHGAHPAMAVRGPVNVIPRELFGIPILAIGILQRKLPTRWADAVNAKILQAVVGDLRPYGLRPSQHGPQTQIREDRRIPLIDIGTIELIKQGRIIVQRGIEKFTEDGVVFTDGKQGRFEAVILATGYRPRVNVFLQEASTCVDENGTPLSSGRETEMPGLYFCGYFVSPTGMLREVGLEAQRISKAIAKKVRVEAG